MSDLQYIILLYIVCRVQPVRSPSVIYLLLGVVINVARLGFYYFEVMCIHFIIYIIIYYIK